MDAAAAHRSRVEADERRPRVFLSYRRDDCQPQANGLADGLALRMPEARVFMDVDSIPFGADFEEHIREEIAACDVVLVLIGDEWLSLRDSEGQRRLERQGDIVRLEVETALATPSVLVIPVLVEGAAMPAGQDLPATISRLSRLNAIELNDRTWRRDVARLAEVVQGLRAAQPQSDASVSAPSEPASPLASTSPPLARTSRTASAEPAGAPRTTWKGLDVAALRDAVARMPASFQTRDVSEDEGVVRATGEAAESPSYHAMVGRWLAQQKTELGLRAAGKGPGGRGEQWLREQHDNVERLTFPGRITSSYCEAVVPHMTRDELLQLVAEGLRRGWSWDDVYEWALAHSPLKPSGALPGRITFDWLAQNVALLSPVRIQELVEELWRRRWSDATVRQHVYGNRQPGLAAPLPTRLSTAWLQQNAPLMTAEEQDDLAMLMYKKGYSNDEIRAWAPVAVLPD